MLLGCYDRCRALSAELGLEDRWYPLEASGHGGVLHGSEVTPFSPARAFDVLRYQGLHLSGRIRLFLALLEAWKGRHEVDFFDLSVGDSSLDEEDCDSFARRRLGDEATDYVVDSFIRTFHFHGAKRMSAKYFEALAALLVSRGEFQLFGLRGSMLALPSALAARLNVSYQTPASVSGTTVTSRLGVETYDSVVLATSAGRARATLSLDSSPQRALLERVEYSSTILCSFAVPREIAGDFEGIWVPFRESRIVSGLANDSCKGAISENRVLLQVWLHEETAAAWLDRSDGEIQGMVAGELIRLFSRYEGALEPIFVHRWPEALPVYGVGQVSQVARFWERGQGHGGLWLCGDYLNHPWVEGAVRCGEKVAHLLCGVEPCRAWPRASSGA